MAIFSQRSALLKPSDALTTKTSSTESPPACRSNPIFTGDLQERDILKVRLHLYRGNPVISSELGESCAIVVL
jgi:hypothetical protein